MKNKKKLIEMFNTMFWSWGGDPQDEVFWAANELLEWIENEFDVKLNIRFERDNDTYDTNFEEVMDAINSL